MAKLDHFELDGEVWNVQPPFESSDLQLKSDLTYPFATVITQARISVGDTNSVQPSFELQLIGDAHRAAFLKTVFGKLGFVVEKADVASKPAFS